MRAEGILGRRESVSKCAEAGPSGVGEQVVQGCSVGLLEQRCVIPVPVGVGLECWVKECAVSHR